MGILEEHLIQNSESIEVAVNLSDTDLKTDKNESINSSEVNVSIESDENCLWKPKESDISTSSLFEFQHLIEQKFDLKFDSYDSLYKWSIDNFTNFWEEFWHFSKLVYSKPYTTVLDKKLDTIDSLPFKWFDGALLNYAENLLKHDENKTAIYSYGESFTQIKSITFKELRQQVKLYQIKLKSLGVKCGDRVVGFMPNCIECVVAKLAAISLGAVWSCTSPDFGSQSVIDRFEQIKPIVLFCVTQVNYNGKKFDQIQKLQEIIQRVDSIQKVIVVPFCEENIENIDNLAKSISLSEFLSDISEDELKQELTFEQVPFNHPLVILYSSGTTGTPKCIVHSHGGTLIQHLKEHILHGNMKSDDIIFYYTSTSWMMYDWLMTSLAVGASIVIYDGSPVLPTEDVLWSLVDKLGITMFGTSAKYLAVIEGKLSPKLSHSLSSLKIIYSTGSPLKPDSFDYVYSSIKNDITIGSITGGSDIISLFCGHNVNLPVYRGEIQCRQLGMAVECWNEDGKHVYNECGELVCTKPFPSMPIYFFNDPNFKRYKSSYFEKFQGVWAHGDFCMINEKTGGVVMLGRSDGTLNPNGIRFGSADIYNCIENFQEIEDSLCVGQKNPNVPEEERVVLFIKTKANFEFNKILVDKIKSHIRKSLSPRHVPAIVLEISQIPYTLNGKKVEVPVRKIIEGSMVVTTSSLANPESLEAFRNIEILQKW